jgi:hypothetical protein
VIARKIQALLLAASLAALCCGDLFAAGARACGDHPCCVKGACKMMPKSGARLDRCGDKQASAPETAPVVLAAATAAGWPLAVGRWPLAVVLITSDGASFGIKRPPRA